MKMSAMSLRFPFVLLLCSYPKDGGRQGVVTLCGVVIGTAARVAGGKASAITPSPSRQEVNLLATHTRWPEIKKLAQSTDRRAIRLWMPKDIVRMCTGCAGNER
jgi:hypothetical protein